MTERKTAGMTLAAAALASVLATAFVVADLPPLKTYTAEVVTHTAIAGGEPDSDWTALGVLPATATATREVWAGWLERGETTPDDVAVAYDRDARVFVLAADVSPAELTSPLARLVPRAASAGPADAGAGWDWYVGSGRHVVEQVANAEPVDALTHSPDRWMTTDSTGRLTLTLGADNPRRWHVEVAGEATAVASMCQLAPAEASQVVATVPRRACRLAPALHSQPPATAARQSWTVEYATAPPWCLRAETNGRRQWLPLDPRTGLDLPTRTVPVALRFGRLASGAAPVWWTKAVAGPEALSEGEVVADNWRVAVCPGASWREKVATVGVGPAADSAAMRWIAPSVGEREVVVGGLFRVFVVGELIRVAPVHGEDSTASPAFCARPDVDDTAKLGCEPWGVRRLRGGTIHHGLLRDSVGSGGTLFALDLSEHVEKYRISWTWTWQRWAAQENVLSRGSTFASLQPGLHRFAPVRFAGDGQQTVQVVVPALGQFDWSAQTWRSRSDHFVAVADARLPAGSQRFRGPSHDVICSVRDDGPWVAWLAWLSAALVAFAMLGAWAKRESDLTASLVATVAGGVCVVGAAALAATGSAHMAIAAVSPLGQNTTIYVAQNLAWLCVGAAFAWLLVCVIAGGTPWVEAPVATPAARDGEASDPTPGWPYRIRAWLARRLGPSSQAAVAQLGDLIRRWATSIIAEARPVAIFGAAGFLVLPPLLDAFLTGVGSFGGLRGRPDWTPLAFLVGSGACAAFVAFAADRWPSTLQANRIRAFPAVGLLVPALIHILCARALGGWLLGFFGGAWWTAALGGAVAVCFVSVEFRPFALVGPTWLRQLRSGPLAMACLGLILATRQVAPKLFDSIDYLARRQTYALLAAFALLTFLLAGALRRWPYFGVVAAYRSKLLLVLALGAVAPLAPFAVNMPWLNATLPDIVSMLTIGLHFSVVVRRDEIRSHDDEVHFVQVTTYWMGVCLLATAVVTGDLGPAIVRLSALSVASVVAQFVHLRDFGSAARLGSAGAVPLLVIVVAASLGETSHRLWPSAFVVAMFAAWFADGWWRKRQSRVSTFPFKYPWLRGVAVLPLWAVCGFGAVLLDRGLANHLLQRIPQPLLGLVENSLIRFSERDRCAATPEAWGFCEQLLKVREFIAVPLVDNAPDRLASNLHSDLAWPHALHVAPRFWILPCVVAIAMALLAVHCASTRRRIDARAAIVATLCMCVVGGYAAFHVLGLLAIVPLSGVPWPLLSYSNTHNALTLVGMALAAHLCALRPGNRCTLDDDRPNRVKWILLAPACAVLAMGMARHAYWPTRPQQSSAPVLLGPSAPGAARTAQSVAVPLPGGPARESLAAVRQCDLVLDVRQLAGKAAQAGTSVQAAERIVRAISPAAGGPGAAIVAGFWLPHGQSRTLCSDATCDWFLDGRDGAALEKLDVYDNGDGTIRVKTVATLAKDIGPSWSLHPAALPTDRDVSIVGSIHGANPEAVLKLRTTAGHYAWIALAEPPAGEAGESAGTAFCLLAGPSLTLASDVSPVGARGLAVGIWPRTRGDSPTSTTLLVDDAANCPAKSGACSIYVGWPSSRSRSEMARSQRNTEVSAAIWQLAAVGAPTGPLHGESDAASMASQLPPFSTDGGAIGWGEDALAAFRPRSKDARRVVRRIVLDLLDLHTLERERPHSAHGSETTVARKLAEFWLPDVESRASEATEPVAPHRVSRRREIRWIDASRQFTAPLTVFLDPSEFGVGKTLTDTAVGDRLRGKKDAVVAPLRGHRGAQAHVRVGCEKDTVAPITTSWQASLAKSSSQTLAIAVADCATAAVGQATTTTPKPVDIGVRSADPNIAVGKAGADGRWTGVSSVEISELRAAQSPRQQRLGVKAVTTSATVLDLVSDAALLARERKERLAQSHDAQVVADWTLLDWTKHTGQAALGRISANAKIRCLLPKNAVYGSDCARTLGDRAAKRQRKVAAMLVDYASAQIIAHSEVWWTPRHTGHAFAGSATPLLYDGEVELASTFKVPMAVAAHTAKAESMSATVNCKGHADGGPKCRYPMGAIGLASAIANSCNEFFAFAGADLAKTEHLAKLLRAIDTMGVGTQVSEAQVLDWATLQDPWRRLLASDWATIVPAPWRNKLATSMTITNYNCVDPKKYQLCSLPWWMDGLGIRAAPWLAVAYYASLARTVQTGTAQFRWPSVADRPVSLLPSETTASSLVAKLASTRPVDVKFTSALLQGMADVFARGTASGDANLGRIAAIYRLLGKTGTSSLDEFNDPAVGSVERRRWHHLVSMVDPRSALAKQRPWLLWVSVEIEADELDRGDFPSEWHATGAAAALWSGLAGE